MITISILLVGGILVFLLAMVITIIIEIGVAIIPVLLIPIALIALDVWVLTRLFRKKKNKKK